MVRPTTRLFPFGKFFGENFRAGIVEAHAVHNRPVNGGAEHSRLWISVLRVPRYAAEFAEAEAEFFPDWNGSSKFIHARREADWIREFQTEQFNGQFRRGK